ncbi:hypothetical protein [Niabella hibiscisoli]|nr:hypothetical protein [Niabella hibiscisoli]
MSAGFLFSIVIAYFLLLLLVAWKTSKNSNNESFLLVTGVVTGCW